MTPAVTVLGVLAPAPGRHHKPLCQYLDLWGYVGRSNSQLPPDATQSATGWAPDLWHSTLLDSGRLHEIERSDDAELVRGICTLAASYFCIGMTT